MSEPDPSAPARTAAHRIAGQIEHGLERVMFASRWLLAPLYVGLAIGLLVLLVKFVQVAAGLLLHVLATPGNKTIVEVLGLIDIALMAGLVLMVMFAGYETFVSRLDLPDHRERPSWMGHVGFGDLKLKLMASIVAISAIHVLEDFMDIAHLTDRELGWALGIHLSFVVSGVLLAAMDRMSGGDAK